MPGRKRRATLAAQRPARPAMTGCAPTAKTMASIATTRKSATPAIVRYVWERCRPAVVTKPVPNSTIRARVDIRLVRAMPSPVMDASMPTASSVLTFTKVPVADPNGVR